jgi:hypothetical protein
METIKNTGISDAQRRSLLLNFKALGLDDDGRHYFISDFTRGRTSSLKDLGYIEAQDLLRYLGELRRNPQERKCRDDLDRKRKGVIKAISAYLELYGQQPTLEYIKGVAVRAAGMVPTMVDHDFNRIPEGTLTRIYNEFCRKQSVIRVEDDLTKICFK